MAAAAPLAEQGDAASEGVSASAAGESREAGSAAVIAPCTTADAGANGVAGTGGLSRTSAAQGGGAACASAAPAEAHSGGMMTAVGSAAKVSMHLRLSSFTFARSGLQ